jgi:putative phosphoribosyl transferase
MSRIAHRYRRAARGSEAMVRGSRSTNVQTHEVKRCGASARSGRPPRETTARTSCGRSAAAIRAAAAPVLAPHRPRGNRGSSRRLRNPFDDAGCTLRQHGNIETELCGDGIETIVLEFMSLPFDKNNLRSSGRCTPVAAAGSGSAIARDIASRKQNPMATAPFRDRREAGQRVARALTRYGNRNDVVVLGLPRGGVPVAFEVAHALRAPLDVFLVRKLGAPGHPEFAIGAIAAGGVRVLSEDVISALGISPAMVEQIAARELLELERRDRAYHGDRPKPSLRGKTVIVIDDGLATGSTMEAAVSALRQHGAAKIVVAAPVGAPDSCERLRALADEVVCVETPEAFRAVGLWYQAFDQTTDAEVIDLLRRASSRPTSTSPVAAGTGIDRIRAGTVALTEHASTYDPLIEASRRPHATPSDT